MVRNSRRYVISTNGEDFQGNGVTALTGEEFQEIAPMPYAVKISTETSSPSLAVRRSRR